MYLASLLLKSP